MTWLAETTTITYPSTKPSFCFVLPMMIAPQVVALSYQIDDGPLTSLNTTDAGTFGEALDLSRLATGSHTITVSARDAAGHVTTVEREVNLAALVPLQVESHLPVSNATEVGVTFRPIEAYAAIGLIYLLLNGLVAQGALMLERTLRRRQGL